MLSPIFPKKMTIFWCIFIVYTFINGLIQGIASIIESSFFKSNEFTLRSIDSKVHFEYHFEVTIKFNLTQLKDK